ncbi:MAG TPA: hypothetical protein DCG19_04075 [Cryomorphaceae bacterium]|nr:hypothetical protein [Owenweeksia sp.]HAD96558.1 hypothetical protein [Cryomorphaceae bacterium]HBF20311.1 hypothetical protein [Cryomorphaceae bacterium]HCQ16010.1 hypothetical protein [Cryomorphaceae bacterium]|tara:strand:+ start:35722 stop:36489 length:768 start_codon:yes stop_codon:yes gene_type:complete
MRLFPTSLLCATLLMFSCEDPNSLSSEDFVAGIEEAHKKEAFAQQEAVLCDIVLSFNGNERINGTMILLTNSQKGRLDTKDGKTIIYDQGDVYYSPEVGDANSAIFDAYTWSYFFLMPFKLSDPGTQWEDYSNKELQGKMYNVKKLTFDEGTGGSPDDWYVMYSDPKTHLLYSAAYIVTANKSKAEAEKDPHAIEYLNYEDSEGVPFAKQWNFWSWRPGKGFTKKLGEANLSRIRFTELNENFFEPLPGMLKAHQ